MYRQELRDSLLHWTEDFFIEREHRTQLRITSSKTGVKSGMRQGLALGSRLFLVYVNDLSYGLESYLNMFADSARVMREIKNDYCIKQTRGP